MNLSKILLTIYTKRIYNTTEGQKHFVLCDETPAFCHFFLYKIERRNSSLYKMDVPIRIRVS